MCVLLPPGVLHNLFKVNTAFIFIYVRNLDPTTGDYNDTITSIGKSVLLPRHDPHLDSKIFLRVAEETGVDADPASEQPAEPSTSLQPSVQNPDQPEEPEPGGNSI